MTIEQLAEMIKNLTKNMQQLSDDIEYISISCSRIQEATNDNIKDLISQQEELVRLGETIQASLRI